ncbi:MAG TPA: sigma-70 family RNA polymerase sigma factor [Firmicutes bacterium]|nr:sigma-70 family RNA polymerase sigma factor [Bacillota bacterium]
MGWFSVAVSRHDTVAETMSDERLVARALQGDEDAFSTLVQRCVPMVKRQAGAFRGTEVEAEDLVQEGLMGLLSAVRTYNPDASASFRTYAGVCIRRRMLSAVKRLGAAKAIPASELVRMDEEGELLETADAGEDPAQLVVEKETLSHLYSRLQKVLSEREYAVLMQYMGGYSYEEIARHLGVTPKSVDNALQRARRKFVSEGLYAG